jgi:hypothetical protein
MDSIDFTGLAAKAVAGLREVRACLLASRDGLTLAALPEGGEELARRALDRLETVGQPDRGFLVIGGEVWVVARRGPYVGILVAAATARAGLLLDRLESTLRAAEEARLQAGSAGLARPDTPRRPRPALHREPRAEPSRPEMKTPDSVFEEVARVVNVPEREAHRAEPSLDQPAPSSSWPQVIREPQAPNGGDPDSPHEPPTIVRPEPKPEPEGPKVVAPEPEEEKVVTPEPEPEEPMVMAPEPEPEPEPEEEKLVASEPDLFSPQPEIVVPNVEREQEEPKVEAPEPEPVPEVMAPEPQPEEPKVEAPEPQMDVPAVEGEQELPIVPAPDPQPAALNVDSPKPESEKPEVEPEPEPMKMMFPRPEPKQESPTVEPAKAEAIPPAPVPEVRPAPPQRLAHPEVEPPKATPRYSPPEALLGEMGRVVAGETSQADILPPGVSPVEMTVAPADATGEEAAEAAETKEPERSKERGEDTEVDPVALAREFSQLFDEPERNS